MTGLDERLAEATAGALEPFGVHLGTRLGLSRALHERGALTSGELAGAARISERYAREWLEQQAVAGMIEVDDPAGSAGERRYRLRDADADRAVPGALTPCCAAWAKVNIREPSRSSQADWLFFNRM
jgi:hypothetical protein